MPLSKMPPATKSGLSKLTPKQRKKWFSTYEGSKKYYGDKSIAAKVAWSAVNREGKMSLASILENMIEEEAEICEMCGQKHIGECK